MRSILQKKTLDKFVGASQIEYHRKTWDILVRRSRPTRTLATAVIEEIEIEI